MIKDTCEEHGMLRQFACILCTKLWTNYCIFCYIEHIKNKHQKAPDSELKKVKAFHYINDYKKEQIQKLQEQIKELKSVNLEQQKNIDALQQKIKFNQQKYEKHQAQRIQDIKLLQNKSQEINEDLKKLSSQFQTLKGQKNEIKNKNSNLRQKVQNLQRLNEDIREQKNKQREKRIRLQQILRKQKLQNHFKQTQILQNNNHQLLNIFQRFGKQIKDTKLILKYSEKQILNPYQLFKKNCINNHSFLILVKQATDHIFAIYTDSKIINTIKKGNLTFIYSLSNKTGIVPEQSVDKINQLQVKQKNNNIQLIFGDMEMRILMDGQKIKITSYLGTKKLNKYVLENKQKIESNEIMFGHKKFSCNISLLQIYKIQFQ